MSTVKVDGFVKFMNAFTPVGRKANHEIKNMKVVKADQVYQKKLPQNTIALSCNRKYQGIEEDSLILVNSGNIKMVKKTKKQTLEDGYLLFKSVKKYIMSGIEGHTMQKERLYNLNTKKIEESANKIVFSDGPSINIVKSKSGRKSTFPVTELGKSVHLAVAQKTVLENGDLQYVERYLKP